MINGELKILDRRRRKLVLKLGLSTLMCFASFGNLSEAENDTFQINLVPYPLANSVNVTAQKEMEVRDAKTSKNKTDYCYEPECIHTASIVRKYMDTSAKPCDDFYKFACGHYIKNEITSDVQNVYNGIEVLRNKTDQRMKRILEQELTPNEPKYLKLMKTLYQNCENTELKSDKEILKLIGDSVTKIDGWRYLKNDSLEDTSFQWEDLNSKLEKEFDLYETPFFDLKIIPDSKNNSNLVFKIQQSLRIYFINDGFSKFKDISDDLSQYDISIENVSYGINKTKETLKNMSYEESNEKFYLSENRMTVKELENEYPNILWRKIFNSRLHPFNEVRDDDIVLVSGISFFEKFNERINNISKKEQAIFLIWRAIQSILIINDDLQTFKDNCIGMMREFFQSNLGVLYVRNYYNETANDKPVDEMFTNIFHQYKIVINNADWLDDKTKEYALEKLDSLYESRQIMYKVPTDRELDEYYGRLEITSDFVTSYMNFKKFNKETEARLFRVPLDRSSFRYRRTPADVNAGYMINTNSIGISPGMLQGDFFNANRPMYMNYGAAGFFIAHEFSHGFDNRGRKYDKNGQLFDWWQDETQEQFTSKAQCFISQYGNYTDEEVEMSVDGNQTLGENIADSGGLKLAYLAYQKWVEDHGPELLLPGVNFTQSQLFWISFAQRHCEKASVESKEALFDGPHTVANFRVIGSLVNRPEFASDFQCLLGSKMHPESKCTIW